MNKPFLLFPNHINDVLELVYCIRRVTCVRGAMEKCKIVRFLSTGNWNSKNYSVRYTIKIHFIKTRGYSTIVITSTVLMKYTTDMKG